MPWRLDVVETRITHAPLEVENVMRMVLAYAGFLLVGGAFLACARRGTRKHGVVFLLSLVSLVSLGVIFLFDQSHTPDGGVFLDPLPDCCVSGVSRGRGVRDRNSIRSGQPDRSDILATCRVGLPFAGLDELFEIQRADRKAIETRLSLPHWISDYITVGYALPAPR